MRKPMLMAMVAAIFCGMFLGAAIAADEKAQSAVSPTKTFESAGVLLPPWLPAGTEVKVALPWFASGQLAIGFDVEDVGQLKKCPVCGKSDPLRIISSLSKWENTMSVRPPASGNSVKIWILVSFPLGGESGSIYMEAYNDPAVLIERSNFSKSVLLSQESLECKNISDEDFPRTFHAAILNLLEKARDKVLKDMKEEKKD